MLKGVVKGGGLILLSVILSKVFSLLYVPILARVLGPDGLGLYNLSLTLLPWVVTLASLSLSTIIAQSVAEHYGKRDLPVIITTYLFFTVLLSIFGGVVHLAFAKTIALQLFHSTEILSYLRLASAGVALSIMYNATLGVARGFKEFALYVQMEVSKSFMLVASGLFFLLVLEYFVQGALFAVILAPIFPISYLLVKHRKYLTKNVKFAVLKPGITAGMWVTILSLFLTVMLTVGVFLLGIYSDPTMVGLYAAIAALMTTMGLIPASFKGSVLPYISDNFTNKNAICSMMQRLVSYTLILVSMALLVLISFRKEIILLLFGKEFLPSVAIVPVLGLTLLPFTIYTLTHSVILDRRLVAHTTKKIFPVTLIALALDVLLIKQFAAVGAAFGVLISHSLVAATYLHVMKKEFQFSLRRLLALLLLSVVPLLAALFLPASLFYRIPLFIVLFLFYSILVLRFQYVTKQEIILLSRTIKLVLARFTLFIRLRR